jgi:cytochrome c-type biogenesis protein CcmH/NrfF
MVSSAEQRLTLLAEHRHCTAARALLASSADLLTQSLHCMVCCGTTLLHQNAVNIKLTLHSNIIINMHGSENF